MFTGCYELKEIKGLNKFNTSKVTNMRGMFQSCNELRYLDLSNFNISNVVVLGIMFQECFELEFVDISNFNCINVKNMEWMFNKCYKLKEIKGINILINIKNIKKTGIFNDCNKLTNIPNFVFSPPIQVVKKQITIVFLSSDQIIQNYHVTCFNTDIFEEVKEKIFWKYPNYRYKELHFLSAGNVINERVSLAQNNIKDGAIILITDNSS